MKTLRVLNIFHRLMPSGAEMMWKSAADAFRRLNIEHILVGVDAEIGTFASELGESYEIVHLPLRHGPWGVKKLTRAIGNYHVDLIHCHSESKGVASALAGKFRGIPTVRTYHNIWNSTTLKHRIRRSVESQLCTRIAVGASVQRVENAWGPTSLITNWAEASESSTCNVPGSSIKLLTVCNTNPLKRCELMLRLVSKHPELDLTHMGLDESHVFERSKLQRLGVENRVRSMGPVRNVVERMPEFDAYVCTSEFEGFSIALTEALLCGLPLAIVDRPGISDMLEYRRTAFIIDPENIYPFDGLEESLTVQRSEVVTTLKPLRAYFSPERGANDYAAVYRKLCAK